MENKYEIVSRIKDLSEQLHAKYDELEKAGIAIEFISEMGLEVSEVLEAVIPHGYGWTQFNLEKYTPEELIFIDENHERIQRILSTVDGQVIVFKDGIEIRQPFVVLETVEE